MNQSGANCGSQRKHPHLQILEIKDDCDSDVGQAWAAKKTLLGNLAQNELLDSDLPTDDLFTEAFQDGFKEESHGLIGGLPQRHKLRVLAEMIEEEFPDRGEVLFGL